MGDILVFPQAEPYALLSAPDQEPDFDFDFDETLYSLREMAGGKLPFMVREGGDGSERTRFVCAYLGCNLRPFNPLLSALPRFIRVKRAATEPDDLLARLIRLTRAEAKTRHLGGRAVGLRLSVLVFVEALRRYLAALPSDRRGWLAGLRDPAVSRALGLLHAEPARNWSLDGLARDAGLPRTVLADRFTQLVGYPPMTYQTLWRMQRAARLLADSGMKIAAVAHEIGYESKAAFSRAFKKSTGMAPAHWRRAVRGAR